MSAADGRHWGDAPDAELEALLRHAAAPAARPEFRARLQRRFVQGEAALEGSLARALESAPLPVARPEFRAALGSRFRGAAEPTRVPRPARHARWRWRLVAAAAAAAAVVVVLRPWRTSAGPRWRLDPALASAAIAIDGRSFASSDELDEALADAETVSSGARAARLFYADRLVLELEPESAVAIEGLDAPVPRLVVQRGSVCVATGPGFTGSTLTVAAPHLELEIVGTIFGIDVYEEATCLCVTEGAVRARPDQGAELVVEAGGSFVVGPGLYTSQEIPPSHAVPLIGLQGVWEH